MCHGWRLLILNELDDWRLSRPEGCIFLLSDKRTILFDVFLIVSDSPLKGSNANGEECMLISLLKTLLNSSVFT